MKYKCLIFDHDDTVVNSTATIHHPCFQAYLDLRYPGRACTLEEYFRKNFDPGFLAMCREEYGMDDAALADETEFWKSYVVGRVPRAYDGLREIMRRQKAEGGIIAVISHSFEHNILRDYEQNDLPMPDAVYGWGQPEDRRKPKPWPVEDILRRFSLEREDVLVIDDLKPGYDMAKAAGVPFAAACWAYDVPMIRDFMHANSPLCFDTVSALADYLK